MQMRGLLGTLTYRAHTTTDASAAKAAHSTEAELDHHGQSTFHMRFTKNLSFPCSETPSTCRASDCPLVLAHQRAPDPEVIEKLAPPIGLSPCVHP